MRIHIPDQAELEAREDYWLQKVSYWADEETAARAARNDAIRAAHEAGVAVATIALQAHLSASGVRKILHNAP